ncbi:nuclear transport factor 2 family protein [Streptomyces sp. NPDC014676]|uniref:nuclear transport factor 2 family protein n=1 Tax=Streptomyces sp. NPDC014676 TaxID=3364879 RepID=UPI003702491F
MSTAARPTPSTSVRQTAQSGLYAEVQLFYARQVHHLDAVRAEEFAATFAEDALFAHSPDEPPVRGRANIAREVRAYNERRFRTDPVQRRHWFTMLDVQEQDDGSVHTEYYALIGTTRPGEPRPVIAPSCLVRDVLVREDGELRTSKRQVTQDQQFAG